MTNIIIYIAVLWAVWQVYKHLLKGEKHVCDKCSGRHKNTL